MVGRTSKYGERDIHGQVGTISDNVPEKVYDPVWNVEMTYAGIMLLQGTVDTTEEGLGRWLADERVYLIDTTAVEVQELIAHRHPDITAVDKEIMEHSDRTGTGGVGVGSGREEQQRDCLDTGGERADRRVPLGRPLTGWLAGCWSAKGWAWVESHPVAALKKRVTGAAY